MALTISLRETFDLCTFVWLSPYSLDGRKFVGFNVDLILLGMLLFSTLVFYAIVLVGSLSFVYFVREKILHLFLIVFFWYVHDYCHVPFVGWKHDVCVPSDLGGSILSSDVWWREFGFGKDIDYLSADIIIYLLWWESVDSWLYLSNNLFFWNLSGCHCDVRVFGTDIASWDKSLLDRSLMLVGCEFLWETRFMYFCFCFSEDCVWVFMACSYVIEFATYHAASAAW